MTVDEARQSIDRGVVYRPDYSNAPIEVWDHITGVSPRGMVFVRYKGDHYSKATRPEDLQFLAPGEI